MRLNDGESSHLLAECRFGSVKFSNRVIELRVSLEKSSLRLFHPNPSLNRRRQEMIDRSHDSILAHRRFAEGGAAGGCRLPLAPRLQRRMRIG
jgi:hypothetical protein